MQCAKQIFCDLRVSGRGFLELFVVVGHVHILLQTVANCLSSYRYLSDEGIAELKGPAENITHSDIIRIALDVSCTHATFTYKFFQCSCCRFCVSEALLGAVINNGFAM